MNRKQAFGLYGSILKFTSERKIQTLANIINRTANHEESSELGSPSSFLSALLWNTGIFYYNRLSVSSVTGLVLATKLWKLAKDLYHNSYDLKLSFYKFHPTRNPGFNATLIRVTTKCEFSIPILQSLAGLQLPVVWSNSHRARVMEIYPVVLTSE